MYGLVKEGARARNYEDAITWLQNAGLVYKVYRCSKPGLPLSAYEDLSAFKLYAADVGLLRRLSQLDPSAYGDGARLFTEFKGALTENFILQGLIRSQETSPRYWSSGGEAEVDFLIQHRNDILPVEVKSDVNVRSRSLTLYAEKYREATKLKLRFSLRNLSLDGDMLNIPLFLIDEVDRFVDMRLAASTVD